MPLYSPTASSTNWHVISHEAQWSDWEENVAITELSGFIPQTPNKFLCPPSSITRLKFLAEFWLLLTLILCALGGFGKNTKMLKAVCDLMLIRNRKECSRCYTRLCFRLWYVDLCVDACLFFSSKIIPFQSPYSETVNNIRSLEIAYLIFLQLPKYRPEQFKLWPMWRQYEI